MTEIRIEKSEAAERALTLLDQAKAITITDSTQAAERALTLLDQAKAITITDSTQYLFAGEFLKALKKNEKEIIEFFKEIKQKIDESKKVVLDKEKEALRPLQEATALIGPLMVQYERQEQEKARQEAARLQEIARKAETERKLDEAIQAWVEGDKFAAEEILSEPVTVPTVTVKPNLPKINGLGTRTTWTYEVTDLMALIRAVAEGKAPRQALTIDNVFMGQQARSLKGSLKWPGVRAVEVTSKGGVKSS